MGGSPRAEDDGSDRISRVKVGGLALAVEARSDCRAAARLGLQGGGTAQEAA
jgi:hypothetical protein